jgi:hypothetical protein
MLLFWTQKMTAGTSKIPGKEKKWGKLRKSNEISHDSQKMVLHLNDKPE